MGVWPSHCLTLLHRLWTCGLGWLGLHVGQWRALRHKPFRNWWGISVRKLGLSRVCVWSTVRVWGLRWIRWTICWTRFSSVVLCCSCAELRRLSLSSELVFLLFLQKHLLFLQDKLQGGPSGRSSLQLPLLRQAEFDVHADRFFGLIWNNEEESQWY